MNLCQYKDIFGEPRKGVHSFRFLNLAIVDVIGTIILAFILKKGGIKIDIISLTIILILSSVYIHRLFCVDTTLTRMFFH